VARDADQDCGRAAAGHAITAGPGTFSSSGATPMNRGMHTADDEQTRPVGGGPAVLAAIPPMPPVALPPRAIADRDPGSEAEPLQTPGASAFRWAVVAVVSVIVLTEGLSRAFLWMGRGFRSGTAPAFLVGAALLLLTPALIFVAVRVFAMGRVGLTAFGMGLRRPQSITDAAILGAAVWFCFLLFAASWVVLTTPKDELERQSDVLHRVDPADDSVAAPAAPDADDSLARPAAPDADGSVIDVPATDLVPAPVAPSASRPTANPTANPGSDGRHVLLKVLGDHPPRRVLILIIVATCLAAPVFEELFFRGFLFRAFAGRFGPVPAMLLSGFLFGLAHVMVLPLRMTVPIGVMGVSLAWLLQQTRSLIPGMAVHGFVNALGTGVSAGFGLHTATLIVGTWIALVVLLLPWLRRPVVRAPVLT
jgi:hypothetical protein